jgi:hypothetical protein
VWCVLRVRGYPSIYSGGGVGATPPPCHQSVWHPFSSLDETATKQHIGLIFSVFPCMWRRVRQFEHWVAPGGVVRAPAGAPLRAGPSILCVVAVQV